MGTKRAASMPESAGKSRGIIFGLDGSIACIILLFSLFIIFSQVGAETENGIAQAKDAEKSLFAASLSEVIVKNRSEDTPWRGSAYYNTVKKRVEVNVLDISLLERIGPERIGKYELSALYERDAKGQNYYFQKKSAGCISVERFVILKGFLEKKAVLGFVVCGA